MKRIIMAVLLLASFPTQYGGQQPSGPTVLQHVTVVNPDSPPMSDMTILITGGRIAAMDSAAAISIPVGAQIIDGRGKFVIPGLMDMHNHLLSGSFPPRLNLQPNLGRMLAVGVTTVFDPSIGKQDFTRLKAAAASDSSAYARFFGTGPMITVKGDSFADAGASMPETPAQAEAAVKDLKALGVDAIKIQRDDLSWAIKGSGTVMPLDVFAAAVKEAHAQGLKVYVHAPLLKLAKEALSAGVDGMMHGVLDEPVDAEFLSLLKKNNAVYVPTLGLFEDVGDVAAFARRQAVNWDRAKFQPPAIYASFTNPAGVRQIESFLSNTAFTEEHLKIARANLKRVFDAGVPVVLGTDTGFPGVFLAVSTQIELELLVEAGLTPADALRAATINAPRMIGKERDLGTVETGKFADLVILDANPLDNIRNVTRIYKVIKGGVQYEPFDPATAR
jgi:imidazolonepropionase-like amidohydrolase